MAPPLKQGNDMTKLNNEICELNSDQLDQVSGGTGPWIPPAEKRAQEIYAMRREDATIQKQVNTMLYEMTHFL
jgi:hypothetical protein